MTKEEHISRAAACLESVDAGIMGGAPAVERLALVVALGQAHIALAQLMQQAEMVPLVQQLTDQGDALLATGGV